MHRTTRPPHRGGFTLIELLIVIAILATLAAITIGIVGSVRQGQIAATTEATMKKIQVALNQQQMAVSEEANKANNPHLLLLQPFCDGDAERAKSLTGYVYGKREFPQTFAESRNLVFPPAPAPPIFTFPGHRAFSSIPPGASGLTADQESAVLLYLIVTGKGNKGTGSSEDAFAGATMTLPNTTYTVFRDGYATHLAFVRWYGPYNGAFSTLNPEVQQPPFINANTAAIRRDPFDPLGRMVPANWPVSGGTNRARALDFLRAPAGSPFVDFDATNKIMTVVSAGPDKAFNTPDDLFGYRLAQMGAKAN